MHQDDTEPTLRIIVLGMNPSKKLGKSQSLHRLNQWMTTLGVQFYSFDNVYPFYGTFEAAQVDTTHVKWICAPYDKVIALGTKVSNILHDLDVDHCHLPHPSGLNRKLNDPIYVHESLLACNNYLYGGIPCDSLKITNSTLGP